MRIAVSLSAILLVLGIGRPTAQMSSAVSIVPSTAKVLPGDAGTATTSAEIHAAQNEFEAFQVVVVGPATGVTISAPTLVAADGAAIPAGEVRLFREAYANVATPSDVEGATGMWPDALIPDVDDMFNEKRNAFPFDVPAGENRAVWVEVHVPQHQTPGDYHGSLIVSGSGIATTSVPVTLRVWDFALPSTSSLASTFGMGWDTACVAHFGSYEACGYDAGVERTHLLYARFMLNHRITVDVVYTGPTGCSGPDCDWSHFDTTYGALFDGTDATLRLIGAKQTSIRYIWQGDASHYAAWAQHFRQRGWFDRTFDYTCDEPPTGCGWSAITSRAAMVHGADPDFRTLVTTSKDEADANGVTSSINILTPIVNFMDDKPGSAHAGNQRSTYDPFLLGNPRNLLWWYQSCMSEGCNADFSDPYFSGWPSLVIDNSAVQNRAQGILSWLYGVTGVLYYATDLHLPDAWKSGSPLFDFGGNGDGTLVYPGLPSVIGGQSHIPVASIRLKMILDGFEDYEYMKLVSDLGDPGFAQQTGRALFPNAYSARQSPSALDSFREALAQRILALKGSTTAAPTVSMTAPATGATVSGSINVSASASDPSGIAGVTFLIDGTPIGSEVTTAPYSISFDTGSVSNGSHAFTARARNASNVTATSAAVNVTVNNSGTTSGRLALAAPLSIIPAAPLVNQSVTAQFTVQNAGNAAISVPYFLVGARNGSNAHFDFAPSAPVTLQPGQQFTYQSSQTFTAAGGYTAWPAYYDGASWIELAPSHTSFTVQQAGPGHLTLISPLSLNPPAPLVNQSVTASFTVQNTGGQPLDIPYFLAGARNASNVHLDFAPSAPVTLQPGQGFTYQASQTFATPGPYSVWPAYYDGSNWIELASSHTAFGVLSSTTRVEENNPVIVLGPGQWNWSSGNDERASAGTYIASSGGSATLQVTFIGAAVSIVGITDSCSGQATITVDSNSYRIDAYRSSGGGWQQTLFTANNLDLSSTHTLTLTVLGTKQSASCGSWIYIDAIDISAGGR